MTTPTRALSTAAFATLVLIAFMMGANHVAARFAINDGVDVATAVAFRSIVTALVVTLLFRLQGVRPRFGPRHRWAMPLIGLLIGVQSLCLYSSVARLPVALALLAFNTYPLAAAAWAWLFYRQRPERAMVMAMPVILAGLALALDISGAAAGLDVATQWGRIGVGVAFGLAAGGVFGLALVITQHETTEIDGRVRTACTMAVAALVALGTVATNGGPHLPATWAGWAGLAGLTFLYGTAATIMFTVLPRLGAVGNSPIMNIEPVFAMVLAWLVLGQKIAPIQVLGALVVVGTVMVLGTRKGKK